MVLLFCAPHVPSLVIVPDGVATEGAELDEEVLSQGPL